MATPLSIGAGANDGLEEYLNDMLRQQALSETVRHNQATESLTGRGIDATEGYRAEAQRQNALVHQQMEQDREARQANMVRDDTRAGLDELMPGAQISKATHDNAIKVGAALPERFTDVKQFPDDFVGPLPENSPQRGETTGYTINPKEAAKPETSETLRRDTINVNGKPEDAMVGEKTGTIHHLLSTGQPPPPGAKITHYEQPDHTLIQSGEGYMPRPAAAAKLAAGEEVPLGTPAQTRTRQDLAQRVGTHFDDVQSLLDEANDKGLLGPLSGRTYTDFMAGKVGSTGDAKNDELLGELRQNLSLLRSGTAQLHGRGGANVGIVQNLEKNMDEGHMSYSELTGALHGMKHWVDTYAAKPNTAAPAATSDPYQDYLNRKK